jgi:hypothetical protein
VKAVPELQSTERCFLVLCGFYFAELIGTRVLGNPGGFESIKKHKKHWGRWYELIQYKRFPALELQNHMIRFQDAIM